MESWKNSKVFNQIAWKGCGIPTTRPRGSQDQLGHIWCRRMEKILLMAFLILFYI